MKDRSKYDLVVKNLFQRDHYNSVKCHTVAC